MDFKGFDLVHPPNRIAAGKTSIAQNIRAYIKGGVSFRNLLSSALYTLSTIVHSIRRLNDSTPNGPVSGFTLINGAGTVLYNNGTSIATGLSGNPVSLIPFRPNTSVQPWMYVGDSAPMGSVTLATEYLINGDSVNFVSNGMMKVRSDGLVYKMGIAEPQVAPVVSTSNSNVTTSGTLLATAIPWTNVSGANSGYNYGHTSSGDGTAPFIVNVKNASFVTITSLTGTATINGGTKTPSSLGPSTGTSTNPGHYVMVQGTGSTPPATATVVIGAFTDGAGNVIPAGVAPLFIPSVTDVGAVIGVSDGIPVPFGAVAFQIGINSTSNTFSANSGSFAISVTVTTNALPSVTAILGTLTAYYFGDSPNSGPVGSYIWKNPDDPGGSGPTRSISNADGSTTGNSFIFDATFTAGIPALPGVGTDALPMEWTVLNPESVATGANPVFAAPLTSTYPTQTTYANFNFCLTGNIYFPQAGNYTFVLTNHDDVIWGIGGGVTLVSASTSGSGEGGVAVVSDYGQTITVVGGYPLLPKEKYTSGNGGNYAKATVVVNVPSPGIYPIEIDYDYWFHAGRILLLMADPTPGAGPTIIPPLQNSVRQNTQYRYVYRSSATGATSNPSPESTVEAVPVTSNTITSVWSPDPQVDVVDYYRIDSVTSDYTYVNTGPNDNAGSGTNTPVTDSLTDTDLGDQLLSEDNFEPFPSIDLPQKGTCNVSGGVITWVSGGAIGGTATGFNTRWLGGTTILIGSPTSLAYEAVRRPTSGTSWDFTGADPEVPDQTGVAYEIEQPTLAAQPLPYLWGPSDNIPFTLGCGDPLRPGTMYWSAGNNLDAAPDTNQQDLTDPSEALVNGVLVGGKSLVFTIKRAIAVFPNFFNAQATAEGTVGSTWSVRTTPIDRGLYMPRCLTVSGGGLVFFRVSDGIHISPDGGASKSITDQDLYPLFPHESSDGGTSVPQPVTRNGVTIYPPDDSQPQKQKFYVVGAYMYYDYLDTTNVPRTLVFDIAAMGFVWDVYQFPATVHADNSGLSVQGTLVGCNDGSIRQMTSSGTETGTAVVQTPAIGGAGWQHLREIVVEYTSTATVTLNCYPADSGNGSYGPQTITLPSTGGSLTKLKVGTGPAPNKWKLMWFQFSWTGQATINFDGFTAYTRSWGSEGPYEPVHPFGEEGGGG